MPLITRAGHARKIISQYRDKRISMPCFCAENTFTMEGILQGASKIAAEKKTDVALYIAVTANYHGRQQLKNYTSLDDTWEGFLAFRSDLQRLCRDGGPFQDVLVIPSLDHGQPGLDDRLFEEGRDFWGCVMYDCSTLPLAENQAKVKEFVEKYAGEYIIEGCVDEITESGQGGMHLTDPQQAKDYIEQTGADLIVANLGTEHRVTGEKKKYHGDLAREISKRTSRRIVLHGTSCLSQQDLLKLRDDGIDKVNIWTILETHTTKELLVKMLENADFILSADEMADLAEKNLLGTAFAGKNAAPNLNCLTELYRRNAVKAPSVARMVCNFMKTFGY